MSADRGFPWRLFWIYVLFVVVSIVLCIGVLTGKDEESSEGSGAKSLSWGGGYIHQLPAWKI